MEHTQFYPINVAHGKVLKCKQVAKVQSLGVLKSKWDIR